MKTNTKSFSEETKPVLYDISDYEILMVEGTGGYQAAEVVIIPPGEVVALASSSNGDHVSSKPLIFDFHQILSYVALLSAILKTQNNKWPARPIDTLKMLHRCQRFSFCRYDTAIELKGFVFENARYNMINVMGFVLKMLPSFVDVGPHKLIV